jgi:DNA topoisomerase-1
MASLPKKVSADELTLDQAVALLAAKAEAKPGKATKNGKAAKARAAKPAKAPARRKTA